MSAHNNAYTTRWEESISTGSRRILAIVLSNGPSACRVAGPLWWVFDLGDAPARFQNAWFLEGLLTQLALMFVLCARQLPWARTKPAPSPHPLCSSQLHSRR